MKKLNTLIITLILAYGLTAQTTLKYHDGLFDQLNTSNLTTNILADKAGLAELIHGFNGSTLCDTATISTWLYAYHTLYTGDIGTPSTPHPDTLIAHVASDPTDVIPLNSVFYKYNYISSTALSNGFIQLIDTLFYDGPNSGNPFLESRCAAIGSMFPESLPANTTFKNKYHLWEPFIHYFLGTNRFWRRVWLSDLYTKYAVQHQLSNFGR